MSGAKPLRGADPSAALRGCGRFTAERAYRCDRGRLDQVVDHDYPYREGSTVIAGGIGTDTDRAAANRSAPTGGQGWLFGRPGLLDCLTTERLAGTVALPAPTAAVEPPPYPRTHFATADTSP